MLLITKFLSNLAGFKLSPRALQAPITYIRQGESFSLSGMVATLEGDFAINSAGFTDFSTTVASVSLNCGTAPKYIPTWVQSKNDCTNHVNETFSYGSLHQRNQWPPDYYYH